MALHLLLQVGMWDRTTRTTIRFSSMSGGQWKGSLKVCERSVFLIFADFIFDICWFYLGLSTGMPASERSVLQEQLIDIILEVLKRNPQLHYYQGYHDVAVTLLLVVGERMAIAMLDTLSNYHLRLFNTSSESSSLMPYCMFWFLFICTNT